MITPALDHELLGPYLQSSEQGIFMDLYIKGVHCGHCVHKIEREINQETDLLNYRFQANGQRLTLWARNQNVFASSMSRIHQLGFEAIPLSENNKLDFSEEDHRSALKKLAVAGVCAGNIMLFSVAIYLGAEVEFVNFFNKLSLALVIPVLTYSATSIWVGFWNSLKFQKFNLDLPIGLALAFGMVLSLFSLFRGEESIYFDSIAIVVFLILASRMALKRYVDTIYLKNLVHFIPGVYRARKKINGVWKWVNPQMIKEGDLLLVIRGEKIPVDGELISDEAVIDQSVLNGEMSPGVFRRGETVFAGTQLSVGEIQIKAEKVGVQTRVGHYVQAALNHVRLGSEESFKLVSRFTLFVVCMSFLTLSYYLMQGQVSLAFQRAFAMIIIACPCAVSFGVPLIRLFTGQLALKNGIVLKRPDVLKKLQKMKEICFDKTGTLTQSSVRIDQNDFIAFTPEQRKNILALELSMDHPISNGFKEFYEGNERLPEVSDFKYHPSRGISGLIDGSQWSVQSERESSLSNDKVKKISIFQNEKKIGDIRLYSSFKKDIVPLFSTLSRRGMKISILSGDESKHVDEIKEIIPISSRGSFISRATPEDKARFIKNQTDSTVMVGDGINDIMALKSASLSICMPGALENNMSIADISLTHGTLGDLQKIFLLSDRVKNAEKRLFAFTLIYNFSCVGLAALGFVTPVAAAIIMPISSFTVLTLVTLSLRKI